MPQSHRLVPRAPELELSQLGKREATAPLTGCYPFGRGGEPVILWNGIARLRSEHGESSPRPVRIEATWNPDARITWITDLENADWPETREWSPPAHDSQALILGSEDDAPLLPSFVRNIGDGWSNGAEFGDSQHLIRVLAHWINLPDFARGKRLVDASNGDDWIGRTELHVDGWALRFDSRQDLCEIYDELKRQRTFAITHIMELRRADGSTFQPVDAEEILEGLQFAISYALGRNSCPALPVGFSQEGRATWTSWRPLHAHHPGLGSQAWWPLHAVADLEQYLEVFLSRWRDPDQRRQLRFLVSWATAASDGTYIEARTTLAISALEHLSWITEVLEGGMDEANWRKRSAVTRLRVLLQHARVDLTIDAVLTPALDQFARAHGLADGPLTILKVRDRLTHPKDTAGLYAASNLIAEASRLACRYLDLAVLHWIGYRGHIRNRTKVRGFVGAPEPVPWAR